MAAEGMETAVLFVIQMKGISYFEPNMATQPEFGAALREAAEAGVKVMARDCAVAYEAETGQLRLNIDKEVEVRLP